MLETAHTRNRKFPITAQRLAKLLCQIFLVTVQEYEPLIWGGRKAEYYVLFIITTADERKEDVCTRVCDDDRVWW